jgi:hypothetical protein
LEFSLKSVLERLVLLTSTLKSALLHNLNSILRLDRYPSINWSNYTRSASYQFHNGYNFASRQLVDLTRSGFKTTSHERTSSVNNLVANGILL